MSRPIRDCVVNRDTAHAAFHGCIDWHSAVHGNYALRVVSRLAGTPADAALAESVANADDLTAELASLNSGDLDSEIPYGFSWFLILDTEARSAVMDEMAVVISDRLHEWITAHIDGDEILRPEYHNLSFAVFALHRWYVGHSPTDASAFRRDVSPSLATGIGPTCSDARPADEFFDPCANLLLALADFDTTDDAIIDDDQLARLSATVQQRQPLSPDEVRTVHSAGLNFSRSWALYVAAGAINAAGANNTAGAADAAGANDQDGLLAAGDRYFLATLNAPDLWLENYHAYSHWVAQFGILALDLRSQTRARR